MNGEVPGEDIGSLERFFAERNVPTRILLCPLAHRTLLPELSARGYRPV